MQSIAPTLETPEDIAREADLLVSLVPSVGGRYREWRGHLADVRTMDRMAAEDPDLPRYEGNRDLIRANAQRCGELWEECASRVLALRHAAYYCPPIRLEAPELLRDIPSHHNAEAVAAWLKRLHDAALRASARPRPEAAQDETAPPVETIRVKIAEVAKQLNVRSDDLLRDLRGRGVTITGTRRMYSAPLDAICATVPPKVASALREKFAGG